MKHPRILFYAVNGLGLGHVTRLLAIARQVRALHPGAEIVFLTSSEAEDVVFREGFAAFKVPSRSIRLTGRLRPATFSRMVQTVVVNLIASFHPHALVVDTFPAGSLQELLPVLRWDSRKIFIYRQQRPEAASSPLMQSTLHLYDLAIAPHQPGEADLPVPDGLDMVWAGPIMIRSREEALPRAQAREILGLPIDGTVLYATFGGGGDAEIRRSSELVTAALEPWIGHSLQLALAPGPLFRGTFPRREGIVIAHHYPMAELYPAFDAAIAAAGYNTATELLHHGVPTVLMPQPRQVDDQQARAAAAAAAGAALMLEAGDAESLRAAVRKILEPNTAAEMRRTSMGCIPENGARTAAAAILDCIGCLPQPDAPQTEGSSDAA